MNSHEIRSTMALCLACFIMADQVWGLNYSAIWGFALYVVLIICSHILAESPEQKTPPPAGDKQAGTSSSRGRFSLGTPGAALQTKKNKQNE